MNLKIICVMIAILAPSAPVIAHENNDAGFGQTESGPTDSASCSCTVYGRDGNVSILLPGEADGEGVCCEVGEINTICQYYPGEEVCL